ncbi:MAG: ATP-binding cassette domain-containing protein [bacterium]
METILEVKGLKKYFKVEHLFEKAKAPVKAVDGVSFSLKTGGILAVVGESGSGKSTMARCICGLETPDSGEIILKGQVLNYSNKDTRRKVQYVFQDTFNSLNPRYRTGEMLEEAITFHFGLKGQTLKNETVRALEAVGLQREIYQKFPHELSGGQRQRVGIARALCLKPEVLVADEPVSSLDVSVQARILKLFSDINKEKNISIIFITHDLRVVKSIADEIIVMYNGKIEERGNTAEVYAKPQSEYTKLLLKAIPGTQNCFT